MHTRYRFRFTFRPPIWLALLPLALSACAGGSGSSGFDITPLSEDAAIVQALDAQDCVAYTSLQVCPLGPLPAHVDEPAPAFIDAELGRATMIQCTPDAGSSTCSFVFPFVPEGFPPTAVFRIAVRSTDPPGAWRIGAVPPLPSAPSHPQVDAPVTIDALPNGVPAGATVQVAVLVFLTPPERVPVEVAELTETGADFAFVTHDLLVGT